MKLRAVLETNILFGNDMYNCTFSPEFSNCENSIGERRGIKVAVQCRVMIFSIKPCAACTGLKNTLYSTFIRRRRARQSLDYY